MAFKSVWTVKGAVWITSS